MALAKRVFHSSCQLLKRSTDHLVTKDNKKFKLVSFPEPPALLPSQAADATKLFARPVSFIQSISQTDQAPDLTNPEVDFHDRLFFVPTDIFCRLRLLEEVTLV